MYWNENDLTVQVEHICNRATRIALVITASLCHEQAADINLLNRTSHVPHSLRILPPSRKDWRYSVAEIGMIPSFLCDVTLIKSCMNSNRNTTMRRGYSWIDNCTVWQNKIKWMYLLCRIIANPFSRRSKPIGGLAKPQSSEPPRPSWKCIQNVATPSNNTIMKRYWIFRFNNYIENVHTFYTW